MNSHSSLIRLLSKPMLLIIILQEAYLISTGGDRSMNSAVNNQKFIRLISVLVKANEDNLYLEKRQPKIAKLREVLSEHFSRHLRAGSSTRALVFSQLRVTVNEIVAELSGMPGTLIIIMCIIYNIADLISLSQCYASCFKFTSL